jgi:hypothetical protein
MTRRRRSTRPWRLVLFVLGAAAVGASNAHAQPPPDKPTLEIYGFGQVDVIADVKQNNPDW